MVVALGAVWLALIGRPLWRLDRKALVFLVAATALGPGLIANTVLKDHWGRARPYQTDSFGGTRQFTPAPLPAAQCERNCAFVSGHAALGVFARQLRLAAARPAGAGGSRLDRCCGFGVLVGIAPDRRRGAFSVGRRLCRADCRRDELAALPGDCRARPARRPGGAVRLSCRRNGRRGGAPRRRRAVPVAGGRVAAWTAAAASRRDLGDLVDRPPARAFPALTSRMAAARRSDPASRFRDAYLVAFGIALCRAALGRPAAATAALGRRDARGRDRPRLSAVSIAASGLAVDLLKVVFGRTRPKLLFADGTYDFSWLGLAADYWSFPSGHTAAVAALVTALWCLWPRHVLFYIALASVVAASRVVTGAHYLSDVVAGGFVAVLVTRTVALGFVRFRLKLPLGSGAIPEPCCGCPDRAASSRHSGPGAACRRVAV